MNKFNRIINSFIIDLRSLSIFRIAIALCVVADLISRFKYIDFFQTADGFLPAKSGLGLSKYLPHFWNDSFVFQLSLFVIALIFAMMLVLGWRTRLATIITYCMLVSLDSLLSISTDGSDSFLRGVLFWSIFLPLGSFWSFDSRYRVNRQHHTQFFSFAGSALLMLFVFYYLSAGLSKLNSAWLVDNALEIILRQEIWLRQAGKILGQHSTLLSILTPVVVIFEIFAPLVLLFPQRYFKMRIITVCSFIIFQFVLGICLQLNMMPWIATAVLLLFLPSRLWDKISFQKNQLYLEKKKFKKIIVIPLIIFVFGGPIIHKAGIYLSYSKAYTLGLKSYWDFYNYPPMYDYDYKIIGQFTNGESVAVLSSLNQQTKWNNSTMNSLWQNYRFKYYLETISYEKPNETKQFLIWIIDKWNKEHINNKIKSAQFYYKAKDISKMNGHIDDILISDYKE